MLQTAHLAPSFKCAISQDQMVPRAAHATSILRSTVLWCGMILLLVSCKTTGTTPDSTTYNFFFSPMDHVKELLAQDKVFDASKVYERQQDYFKEGTAKQLAVIGTLWTSLKQKITPEIEAAAGKINEINWPVKPDRWAETRQRISEATSSISRIDSHLIVREARFPFQSLKSVKTAIEIIEAKIRADAPEQFRKYPVTTAKNFFVSYPVALEVSNFICRNCSTENRGEFSVILKDQLEEASADDLLHVFQAYKEQLSETDKLNIGRKYYLRTLHQSEKLNPQDLRNVVSAVMSTRETGLPLKDLPGVKLGLIEITSKTLLKEGQIEFPIAINVDLPFQAEKASLDVAFTSEKAESADHLIIMDVALAKAERRVLGIEKIPSRRLTGYRTDPNPDYNMAQNSVNNARLVVQQATMNKMSADSQWCQGLGCLGKAIGQIAAAVKVKNSQTLLQDSMSTLNQTPMTVERPIFAEYKFDKATIKATKTMTVNYYIVDRRQNTYFKSNFDVIEKKSFEVAYRVHDRDPNKDEHFRAHDTEDDVVEWEEAASTVKLSQLIQHYFDSEAEPGRLGSLVALRKEMLNDKNKALAILEADRFKARPVVDPRLEHVVVIFTGEGSLGSGFFVKSDIVLTNWHVVDKHKFVELKTHDGRETFGKVLAKDVRLDLALIKVQSRGVPVNLYGNKQITLGQTVEAIGHPTGLQFSITRGIISAVRPHPSINLPGGGGKDVLYVQTDAPINRGNSGGPLFLGNKVIGVNTWKQNDIVTSGGGRAVNIGEGLNFSIHYSEVTKFLTDNLTSYTGGGS